MKERMDQNKLVVIPIFYKVGPYTVRELKGEFGKKFRDLVQSVDKKTKTTWKEALKSISVIVGFVVDEKSDEYELITNVVDNVKQVLRRLSQDSSYPPKLVVGLSPKRHQICHESPRGIEHPHKQQEAKLSYGYEETTTRTIGITTLTRKLCKNLKNGFLKNEAPPVPTSSAAIDKESAVANDASIVSKDLMVNSVGGFDLDGLLKASEEVLGKGTLGSTYKASFDHGLVVAVKRLKVEVVPKKELKEKLQVLGSLSHGNLVTLIAYYFSRDEKLLVFEYMSRGSLAKLLHGEKGGSGMNPLNWETRSLIALGVARAISYLHSRDETHGNIKSSNILLSESFEAKVSDYCLTPIISPTYRPNHIDGYSAPEVIGTSKISQKADVYSFGVLLLELLTGKSPSDEELHENGIGLPRWVSSYVKKGTPAYVFDPELARYRSEDSENMFRLLNIGIRCTAQYPDSRPSMPEVTRLLEEISRWEYYTE